MGQAAALAATPRVPSGGGLDAMGVAVGACSLHALSSAEVPRAGHALHAVHRGRQRCDRVRARVCCACLQAGGCTRGRGERRLARETEGAGDGGGGVLLARAGVCCMSRDACAASGVSTAGGSGAIVCARACAVCVCRQAGARASESGKAALGSSGEVEMVAGACCSSRVLGCCVPGRGCAMSTAGGSGAIVCVHARAVCACRQVSTHARARQAERRAWAPGLSRAGWARPRACRSHRLAPCWMSPAGWRLPVDVCWLTRGLPLHLVRAAGGSTHARAAERARATVGRTAISCTSCRPDPQDPCACRASARRKRARPPCQISFFLSIFLSFFLSIRT